MSALGLVTVTHSRASLDILESVSYVGDDLAGSEERLRDLVGVRDAAILSTCNRTEIYAIFDGPADPSRLGWFLAQDRKTCWGRIRDHVNLLADDDAIAHLFRVASGIESLAFGEAEIVAQIKAVHAGLQGSSRRELMGLFEAAIRASRAVRRRVDVAEGSASLGAAAVAAAGIDDVSTPARVLVVGAGKIARSVLAALPASTHLVVANRTLATAQSLAQGRGRSIPMDEFPRELALADAVFFCASSRRPLLDAAAADAITSNRESPLTAVDLGLPRNVAAEVRLVGGIEVIDLDGLRSPTIGATRLRTLTEVEPVIAEHVARYRQAAIGRSVAPLIEDLRSGMTAIAESALDRAFPHGGSDRARTEKVVRGVAGTLLHNAITEARRAASDGDVETLAALARVFGSTASKATAMHLSEPSKEEEVA